MAGLPLVMVVDDDPLMHALYEEALSEHFSLLFAESGEQALEVFARSELAIIVLDVQMPGLDGYETCRRLKQARTDGPSVVFVSSQDQLADRMLGFEAGGSDYVTKPWAPPELVVKLQLLLEAEARRKALAAERDEAFGAVLQSADMAGELGVVLDFQRELNNAHSYAEVATQMFAGLARYGLQGFVRISGQSAKLATNHEGECTALEKSILETLAARTDGPRIQPLGNNTSFRFGCILLVVRDLPMLRPASMDPELSERHGRAIDNVALMLEAAASRLGAVDNASVAQDLDRVRRLLALTKGALAEVSRRNVAMTTTVQGAFDHLQSEMEESFIHLGLMSSQEEQLSYLVRDHAATAMEALAQGRATEAALQRIIQELGQT
jgi:CheY-like chemotaxis protein